MKKVFLSLLIAVIVVLSGCNSFKTCPTYAKEKTIKNEASSMTVETTDESAI
jgi:uncharacterized protein YceK